MEKMKETSPDRGWFFHIKNTETEEQKVSAQQSPV